MINGALLSLIIFLLLAAADAAKICPRECSCISNAENRPEIEETEVDCAYKHLDAFPVDLPHSTTTLLLQGNNIGAFSSSINGVAFTKAGTPYEVPLEMLRVLRLDKNPLSNITSSLLDHEHFASLQWLYVPPHMSVFRRLPLRLVDLGVPRGWRALPSSPLENKEYTVWTRETVTAILDSERGIEA